MRPMHISSTQSNLRPLARRFARRLGAASTIVALMSAIFGHAEAQVTTYDSRSAFVSAIGTTVLSETFEHDGTYSPVPSLFGGLVQFTAFSGEFPRKFLGGWGPGAFSGGALLPYPIHHSVPIEMNLTTPVLAVGADTFDDFGGSPSAGVITLTVTTSTGAVVSVSESYGTPGNTGFLGARCPTGIVKAVFTISSSGDNLFIDNLLIDPVVNLDSDSDGLLDTEETLLGTDPNDSDTDDDLVLDGTEIDMAQGSGCPDPLDPDSDDDGLMDRVEVDMGTSLCNPDTDGDGVDDALDPTPLVPGVPVSWIEEFLRSEAAGVLTFDIALFDAPNNNARSGRRNAMVNKLTSAANKVATGDRPGAIDDLRSLLEKLDGDPSPPDWMVDGPEKDNLVANILLVIYLLGLP